VLAILVRLFGPHHRKHIASYWPRLKAACWPVPGNDAVPAILAELAAAAIPVVLVADTESASVPLEVHLVSGDPTDETVLKSAKPEAAEQALITGQSDGDVLVSAVLVRKLAPGLETAALVSSPAVREALTDLGVRQVVSAHALIASTLAKCCGVIMPRVPVRQPCLGRAQPPRQPDRIL
jgi:hypothetical protein